MNAKISYHYQKNFADFKMERMHTHDKGNFEVMYIKGGNCTVATPFGEHRLSAGEFILLGNECPHLLEAQNATILNIEFYIKAGDINIDSVMREYPELYKIFEQRALSLSDKSEVFSALLSLVSELRVNGEGLCSELLFKRLLIEVARTYKKRESPSEHYVRAAIDYIDAHFCERLSVSDVAREVGINRSYLQSLFKSATGKTILEYINSLRIAKACFMMKNTDLSVVDIALDCGFASRQHFMYIFKGQTGMTARQYRGGNKDYERE